MRVLIITLILIAFLSGCAGTGSFKESTLALAKPQYSDIAVFGRGLNPVYGRQNLREIFTKNTDNQLGSLLRKFRRDCEYVDEIKTDIGLVSIASAIVKMVYDNAIDKTNKNLDELKKSAVATYSSSVVLEKEQFEKVNCIVISRHSEGGQIDAILLLTVNSSNGLTIFKPTLSYARNTIANTRKPGPNEHEEISLSIAASIQGIGKQSNGLPVLASTGQDVKKVGKIRLGDNPIDLSISNIQLGPIPNDIKDSPVIIRISLTELGDIGFDVNEKIAANEALKEAIGPALAEGLGEYLAE